MQNFLKIVRQVVSSPWFLLYWAISSVGIVASYFNTGATGTPILGATSIIASLVCTALLYWQLAKLREQNGFREPKSPWRLFVSFSLFRCWLLLGFLPFLGVLYYFGYVEKFTQTYLVVSTAPPETKLREMALFVRGIWPAALLYVIAVYLDLAGRTSMLIKGESIHALKRLPAILCALWRPLFWLGGAMVLLLVADELCGSHEAWAAWAPAFIPSAVAQCLLSGVDYVLQIASILYLAQRLGEKSPS